MKLRESLKGNCLVLFIKSVILFIICQVKTPSHTAANKSSVHCQFGVLFFFYKKKEI